MVSISIRDMIARLRKGTNSIRFFSAEHRALANLANVLSPCMLQVAGVEADKLLFLRERGTQITKLHGEAMFHPWRDPKKMTRKWTKKA